MPLLVHNDFMPRRKLIRQNQFPYHVMSRTNHKDWFKIPLYEVWDICKEAYEYAFKKHPVILHCFVLMGNHYHMLITTPNSDIDKFIQKFNHRLSILITKHSGVINHKFSNRYKWTIVNNQNYLLNVYRYIYQNPVRAGITKECFHYPYSSLHFSRYEAKKFNLKPHIRYSKEKYWIERNFGAQFVNTIRNSLRRERFRVVRDTQKYHKSILDNPKTT